MKNLVIIRHAKSSWSDPTHDDFDRSLNPRGFMDAPEMGRRLAEKSIKVDRIISSTANRARTTAEIFMQVLDLPKDGLDLRDELYLASADEIMNLIRDLENTWDDVALVGHNPGMTALVNHLAGVPIDNMPTCAVVRIEMGTPDWKRIKPGDCRMVEFDYPKKSNS
jgi:phosphohistidine phosphatase